jgi:hypothetical protein
VHVAMPGRAVIVHVLLSTCHLERSEGSPAVFPCGLSPMGSSAANVGSPGILSAIFLCHLDVASLSPQGSGKVGPRTIRRGYRYRNCCRVGIRTRQPKPDPVSGPPSGALAGSRKPSRKPRTSQNADLAGTLIVPRSHAPGKRSRVGISCRSGIFHTKTRSKEVPKSLRSFRLLIFCELSRVFPNVDSGTQIAAPVNGYRTGHRAPRLARNGLGTSTRAANI